MMDQITKIGLGLIFFLFVGPKSSTSSELLSRCLIENPKEICLRHAEFQSTGSACWTRL